MNYDKKIYEQLKVMNKHLKVIGDELQNKQEIIESTKTHNNPQLIKK